MIYSKDRRSNERGNILLVVVFIATAIAGLAALSSGRVVSETKQQRVLEEETRAFNSAYAQLHIAMNVVNNSAYNEKNQNLALRNAVEGVYGGTIDGATQTGKESGGGVEFYYDEQGQAYLKQTEQARQASLNSGTAKATIKAGYDATTTAGEKTGYGTDDWMSDPANVSHGLIQGTNVRVYRARDYIKRLQKLKGDRITDVDPFGDSESYFILEASGRIGDTVRLVSALVRENEPFSSFVFFQNRATLGVSGAPRGLIHSNEKLAFYFPKGNYVDSVSAVDGFEYLAGATPQNTSLRDANSEAAAITLEAVDFADLKSKSDLFVGEDSLDAEIKMYRSGKVRIRQYTAPRYDVITTTRTKRKYVGYHYEMVKEIRQVKVGKKKVPYQKKVVDYYKTETYSEWKKVKVGEKKETYWVTEKVKVGTKTETYYETKKVQVGTKKVKKTKQEPIWGTRTVTKYRKVKVWVPYSTGGAGGGTSVGGGGSGELGEWKWVDEPYQAQENYISGYKTVVSWVTEPVYETQKIKKTRQVAVYENQKVKKTKVTSIYEKQKVTKTRKVPVYKYVTKYKTVNVYEGKEVTVRKKVKDYEEITTTRTRTVFQRRVYQKTKYIRINNDKGGTVYIDGRVTRLYGDIQGRLTIVGNEKVRITGNIRYVDSDGDTAMKNGGDYTKAYDRNSAYEGRSVLGVIAREDIIFTRRLPCSAEINGTLMSVDGRVGVDGFWAMPDGELVEDSSRNRRLYLTKEQQLREKAYDRYSRYRTKRFTKDSLRRIGGIISNNRIMETYVKSRRDGTSYVASGFKRGNMKFDINLLFNPPPNFVEVPRPVLTYFVPIMMVRHHDV